MDDPNCDPAALELTYAQFRVINTVVAGWQLTYHRHLRPALAGARITTVLDIGCGGGDLARTLARWAARDGYSLRITGIDPDPRAHAWAVRQPAVPGVSFRQAFSADLVAEGRSFDLVISNHLLHHLHDAQVQALLDDSQQLARNTVVHSDIARSQWAYRLFSAGTWPFFRGSFIREDGLISIRRSYTTEELREVAPPRWQVQRQPPWRNLLIHDTAGA